jgi:hypothetical protein
MCVFCVAIPTATVSGMALDQQSKKLKDENVKPFYLRPIIYLTIMVDLLLMAASVFFHCCSSM